MDLREIKRDTNEWEMHLTKDQVCLGYRFQNWGLDEFWLSLDPRIPELGIRKCSTIWCLLQICRCVCNEVKVRKMWCIKPLQVVTEIIRRGRNHTEQIKSLLLLDILIVFGCRPWVVSRGNCAPNFVSCPRNVRNTPILSFTGGLLVRFHINEVSGTYTSVIIGNGRSAEFAERPFITFLAMSNLLMMIIGSPRIPRLRDMTEPILASDNE